MARVFQSVLFTGFFLCCLGIYAQGNSPRDLLQSDTTTTFLVEFANPDPNMKGIQGSENGVSNKSRTGIGFGFFSVIGALIPPGVGFHFTGYFEKTINLSLGYTFSFIFGHGIYAMSQVRFLNFLSAMVFVNRVMTWTGGSENMLTFGIGFWGIFSFLDDYEFGQSDEFLYVTYTPINWDVYNYPSGVENVGRVSVMFGVSP